LTKQGKGKPDSSRSKQVVEAQPHRNGQWTSALNLNNISWGEIDGQSWLKPDSMGELPLYPLIASWGEFHVEVEDHMCQC